MVTSTWALPSGISNVFSQLFRAGESKAPPPSCATAAVSIAIAASAASTIREASRASLALATSMASLGLLPAEPSRPSPELPPSIVGAPSLVSAVGAPSLVSVDLGASVESIVADTSRRTSASVEVVASRTSVLIAPSRAVNFVSIVKPPSCEPASIGLACLLLEQANRRRSSADVGARLLVEHMVKN